MKKSTLFSMIFLCAVSQADGANLIDVYQQALCSDPLFQQAINQQLATGENVPISRASLLPNLGLTASPFILKETGSGPASPVDNTVRQRGYEYTLTLTQTIFNLSQFANFALEKATAKQAVATLNAASQDLMIRVAKAYFQVLEDEDILKASAAAKTAFAKQLDQATQQYKVGLKTLTDVYTAQASYEGSVADYIQSQTNLSDDKENLRVITGILYPTLAHLSDRFPLITPKPAEIEAWVDTALKQNWQIKADQYAVVAAMHNVKQQFAGHMPTVNLQGQYAVDFTNDMTKDSFATESDIEQAVFFPRGTSQTHTTSLNLNVAVPIYQGGLVVAQTRQAQYQYQVAEQVLEQQVRGTANLTRQSYLGVIAGISKIKADLKSIQSAKSSLEGMEAGYRVGTEILVNVLNQQQQVLTNEKLYAQDRYKYVNDLLALKQAAGTLSPEDLASVNAWLLNGDAVNEFKAQTVKHKKKKSKATC